MPTRLDGVLFPAPRRLDVRPGNGPVAATCRLETAASSRLGPESFTLEITADRAVLNHSDDRGRRYGTQAFEQIRQAARERLPQLRIDDSPDFAIRGFSLDVSRDRVPTRATLARLVEILALARFNHFQLYLEHTFAYRDHETVWRHASPITADDLAWLRSVCSDHGIDLVACQNTLGHFERWLRHDAYRPRAECPDGTDLIPGIPVPPDTLAPTDDNARFVNGLLAELLEALPSQWVNVCADEPFQLGRCASAGEVRRRGRQAVYVDYLRKIVEPLADAGHDVAFYADVIRAAPELVDELPPAATPVVWGYEAPRHAAEALAVPEGVMPILEALNIDPAAHASFAANVAPLVPTGRRFWVAPGTSSWNSFTGRLDNALANLLDAAEVGLSAGAGGYLLTDWGDNGHFQPPSVSFAPMVAGGAFAWCLASNRGIDVAATLDRYVFADRTSRLGAALVELGRVWRQTGLDAFNASPLFAEVVVGTPQLVVGEIDPDGTRAVVAGIEAAVDAIAASRPECSDGDLVRSELATAAGLARHGALRLLNRAGQPAVPSGELRADLDHLAARQRADWLERARPGGLADSLARLDPLRAQ